MNLKPVTNGGARRATLVGSCLFLLLALLGAAACGRAPRFSNTFDSPQALATAVVQAAAMEDRETLQALALSESEFRDAVFPEMPAFGKIPMDYVWGELKQKSDIQIARIMARSGSWDFDVESVIFDGGATVYDTFVVHRDPRLVLRKRSTREKVEVALFGSVIEAAGQYKLFSYVVNR